MGEWAKSMPESIPGETKREREMENAPEHIPEKARVGHDRPGPETAARPPGLAPWLSP